MPLLHPVIRVLVVDDETIIADTLAMILRTQGYASRVAYCGDDAMSIALEFQPHAVISDVVMPGMNGIELANLLTDHHLNCKVLLVSGNAITATLLEDSAQRGRHHIVLPKPVHPAKILEFVQTCIPAA